MPVPVAASTAPLQAFSVARIPRIEFGTGALAKVPEIAARFGSRALLVTGARSFLESEASSQLTRTLAELGVDLAVVRVAGEPSPDEVDAAVVEHAGARIEVVLGIGGGSALDAGKAIAGLLRLGRPVTEYLEGVGPELSYPGPSTPFIAVPTTAGTGSEATKNAVLSKRGVNGYKKSFRDERLVPEYAVVDPNLLASCPRAVIAANGMDALTQLIESYVSLRANPWTDALVVSGLRAARDGLLEWYEQGAEAVQAQARMAYAALVSGIALAQTGLGSVHGLAAPLGALFPAPHGAVCGTLVAEATATNIRALRAREPHNPALARYARLAEILCERRIRDPEDAWAALVGRLQTWSEGLALPRLAEFGMSARDIDRVVASARGSSMRTNPIVLEDAELGELLARRL